MRGANIPETSHVGQPAPTRTAGVTPDEAIAAAILRQRELAAAIEVKESAARARDEAVDAALAAGVTAYRVAQVLGLSQSTVHKIRYRR